MAALLKKEHSLETELIEGGRGEFTVWVDGNKVAEKIGDTFPEDEAVKLAVRQALA